MVEVTNKATAPLGLPNGPLIPIGGTITVEKWSDYRDHAVVKAWIKEKRLMVKGKDADGEHSESTNEDGDTLAMAEMRQRFDAAFADQSRQLEEARKTLAERDTTIADLTERLSAQPAPLNAANEQPTSVYTVKEKSAGWFVIVHDEKEVTKSLRKDAVEGFDAKSDDEKAKFVEANKVD